MSTAPKHIVAFPYQAWGHARPLINLAARLVKMRNINVTMLSTDLFYDRAVAELARSFVPGEEEFAKRIRVVSLSSTNPRAINGIDDSFKGLWTSIANGEAVTCSKTGTQFAALPPPQAVIIDFFAIQPIRAIRKLSGNSVKIYSWIAGSTYALFYVFGPEKLGGRGDINVKVLAEIERTGRPFDEVANEIIFEPKGEVVKVPALPPMYDYEYYPQDFPFPEELATGLFPYVHKTLEVCDGAFLITAEPYEPEAVAAVRGWYAETGRPVYVCGPLLPPTSATATAKEKQQSKEAIEISEFLDTTLKTSGEKSLLYISFGSIFWPVKSPENIWAFLDVVMERNIPFILSHASPIATVPDEIKEKVKAYGKGILSPWSPQQTILEHPVTGWFLAHGGHNGVTESICAGVPFILWPFGGDQPMNAVHISEQLKVGYELIEVRTGTAGRHTIYRNGRTPSGTIEAIKDEARDVLAKAYGPDGAEKRQRLVALQHAITHEWEEGGAALRDVKAFLENL
ncbi:UDP-glycosyltransferase 73E1 [Trametes pubescens]|uniref:UDP-glycosyltransferase 73E1 n=1 Tax=Trametes pubescens TaxID=154538 RepID=A0A1M2VXH6_TRAPU|nr:UDP-glycosyltransferase 73E1 [Trametes pubescens]